MAGLEDLRVSNRALDNPYIQAKLEKYYKPHVHTENLMNEWQKEIEAKEAAEGKKPRKRGDNIQNRLKAKPSIKVQLEIQKHKDDAMFARAVTDAAEDIHRMGLGSKPKPKKRRKNNKRAPAKRNGQVQVERAATEAGPPAARPAQSNWVQIPGSTHVTIPNDVTGYEDAKKKALAKITMENEIAMVEAMDAKTKEKPRHRKRRVKRHRQKDRDPQSGGQAAKASGWNGHGDGGSGEVDAERGIHPREEEIREYCNGCLQAVHNCICPEKEDA